ncbi:MAG: histidine phosphatase family protein [Chloroflexota bacterium]|nr:histidine phosphatase family protein [Chloroflexota bacterium]
MHITGRHTTENTNRLYLVRHGESWTNVAHQLSHKLLDYSLTPKGALQAQHTAEYFKGREIAEICTSPLKRAVETAEIIAEPLGLHVVVLENFREVNVGVLETQQTAESWALDDSIVADWLSGNVERAFPGGEDYVTLLTRVQSGVERVIAGKTDQNIIIVGHYGVFTTPFGDICRNVDAKQLRRIRNRNCSISEVVVGLHNGRLEGELINWASHDHLRSG